MMLLTAADIKVGSDGLRFLALQYAVSIYLTVHVRPSVCLSVPSIDSSSDVQLPLVAARARRRGRQQRWNWVAFCDPATQ